MVAGVQVAGDGLTGSGLKIRNVARPNATEITKHYIPPWADLKLKYNEPGYRTIIAYFPNNNIKHKLRSLLVNRQPGWTIENYEHPNREG